MKQILLIISLLLTSVIYGYAADNDAESTIKKVSDAISGNQSTEANITFSAPGLETPSKGVIKLQGNMTRIIMPDFQMWYDGTTMWAYSEATGEVNMTSPSADELVTISPYAALNNYKPLFNIKGDKGSLILTPKDAKSLPYKEITLQIDNTKGYITKAVVTDINGGKQTIVINNYKKGNKLPESAFKFNKAEVPQGTPVIDLR